MQTTRTIEFKVKSVIKAGAAVSIAVLALVYLVAAFHQELGHLRDQNRILGNQLVKLDDSFKRIHLYTKSAGALVAGDVKPSDVPEIPEIKEASFGSSNYLVLAARSTQASLSSAEDVESFTRSLSLVDSLNRDTDSIVRRLGSLSTILKYNKDLMKSMPSMMPVDGRISSEFGYRLSPFDGKKTLHAGIDIAAVVGSEVQAPADGTVTFVGNFDSLGLGVVISHGNSNILTRYGHLSSATVRVGDKVKRGKVIAYTGNSGNSTGPHLHYEVWVRNQAVNPADFFFDMIESTAPLAQTSKAVATKERNVASVDLNDEP